MAMAMARIYRRALALSLLLAACALFVELLVAPVWRAYQDNRETLAELRDHLVRYRAMAATRDDAEGLLVRLAEQQEHEALTLNAPNVSQASAALQESVKTLINESGGKLMSTRMLPAKDEGAAYRVAAQVRLQADSESLGPALYALESHFPYLFLDGLTVVSRGARRARRGPAPSIPLDVTIEVAAYLRADGLEARAAP